MTSTCPSGGLEDFQDSFSSPLNLSIWGKYAYNAGSIDAAGGVLIAKPGMNAGNYVGISSNQTFTLDGCMMWVEVKQVVKSSQQGDTYFMATVSGSMDAEMMTQPESTSPTGLEMRFSVEENSNEDTTGIHYSPVEHRWWRMRFPKDEIRFDTSPDGKTWTERRMVKRPSGMTTVNFELGAGTFGPNGSQPIATFDNVNTPPP